MSSQYGATKGRPSIPQSTRLSTEKGGPPSPAQKRDGVRLSTTSKFKRIISTGVESEAEFPGGGNKVRSLLSLRKQDMGELEEVLRSWGIKMRNGKGILWRGAGTTSPSFLGKQLHSAASK